MKKILLILFIGIFLISLTSAEIQTLGTFKQRECINLIQTCENCTYNNISSVLYPNSSVVLSNIVMTKDDTYYNYTFCNTSTLGSYIVNGYGDLDGERTTWNYDFKITPSGNDAPSDGEGIVFLGSLIAMLLVGGMFLYLSSSFKESPTIRLVFTSLTAIICIIIVLYSTVSLMEVFWGFDKIISSYSIFQWIFLFIVFITFVAVLIAILLKALDSMRIKKGLKDEHE